MVGAFAVDTFLPSFPAIAADFSVGIAAVQQALSAYLLAFSVMCLFHGTLSDAGLTSRQHGLALLAFNLGIETMQLTVLVLVLPSLLVLCVLQTRWYKPMRRLVAALAGLMACAWAAQRADVAGLGNPAWLDDGGMVPTLLVGFLWLGALAALSATRVRRSAIRS